MIVLKLNWVVSKLWYLHGLDLFKAFFFPDSTVVNHLHLGGYFAIFSKRHLETNESYLKFNFLEGDLVDPPGNCPILLSKNHRPF